MHQVASFMEVFLLVILGFAIAIRGLTQQDDLSSDGFTDVSRAITSQIMMPLWTVFGQFPDLEQQTWLASPLLWIQSLTCTIVLVNMLVAMFTDTYERVIAEAETEHLFLNAQRAFQHNHAMHVVPPPFNLPILAVADLGRLCACLKKKPEANGSFRSSGPLGSSALLSMTIGNLRRVAAPRYSRQPPSAGAPKAAASRADLKKAGTMADLTKFMQNMVDYTADNVKPVALVLERVCADEYVMKKNTKTASSTEGRIKATQSALATLSTSVAKQLEQLQQQQEEMMEALRNMMQGQQRELSGSPGKQLPPGPPASLPRQDSGEVRTAMPVSTPASIPPTPGGRTPPTPSNSGSTRSKSVKDVIDVLKREKAKSPPDGDTPSDAPRGSLRRASSLLSQHVSASIPASVAEEAKPNGPPTASPAARLARHSSVGSCCPIPAPAGRATAPDTAAVEARLRQLSGCDSTPSPSIVVAQEWTARQVNAAESEDRRSLARQDSAAVELRLRELAGYGSPRPAPGSVSRQASTSSMAKGATPSSGAGQRTRSGSSWSMPKEPGSDDVDAALAKLGLPTLNDRNKNSG